MVTKKKIHKAKKRETPKSDLKIERIKTGIPGLDRLIQGGFIKGSTVLVCGDTGTGKTIFCLHYLWEGLKNNEPCIYITLEESAEDIKKDALVFGFDFEKYEKSGKFKIIEKNVFENPDLEFFEVDRVKAKRVVIDSISLLSLSLENQASIRNKLLEIITSLKKRNTTTLMTSETGLKGISRYGVEEYIVDGVIVLKFTPIGSEAGRSLFIRKMRRTNHSEEIHPIKIGKGGIKILNL